MITVANIQQRVAASFGLSLIEMTSQRRSVRVSLPRQIAMYLSRELTHSSLPKIGLRFGGRDHTTVMHAISRVTMLMDVDHEFQMTVAIIRSQLEEPEDEL